MNTPFVSVIIPCYGVEKYLDRCMESVVNQTLKDIEIILVDDVSPDRVPEMCDEWAKKDSRVKVIHKGKNEGLGFARNSGLEVATGEYVAFVDSDDFVDKTFYDRLYKKAKEVDFDVVYCNCNSYIDEHNIVPRRDVKKETVFRGREEVNNFLLDIVGPMPEYNHDVKYMMSVWHGIYRKEIFDRTGVRFVSERELISEDLIFDIDILPHVGSICYLPDCLYYYVVNLNSLSHTFDDKKYSKRIHFLYEVENRLSKLFPENKFKIHYQRYVFLILRNNVKRLINNNSSAKTIKGLIDEKIYGDLLKHYPFYRMDIKHFIVFLCIKFRLIFILKIIFSDKTDCVVKFFRCMQ